MLDESTTLPSILQDLIGKSVPVDLTTRLRRLLRTADLSEDSVGGSLDSTLSRANDNAATSPTATYFVIHDTSSPLLKKAEEFPSDQSENLNSLRNYGGPDAVAHIFVNRRGTTLLGHDFSTAWRATKFEVNVVGTPAKGLFLHVELLQPRMSQPGGPPGNDFIAPDPGFTQAQYDKLAIIYIAASSRAGHWLVPAFHAVIDEGIRDSHDDPQNFDISQFARSLEIYLQSLNSLPNDGTVSNQN